MEFNNWVAAPDENIEKLAIMGNSQSLSGAIFYTSALDLSYLH